MEHRLFSSIVGSLPLAKNAPKWVDSLGVGMGVWSVPTFRFETLATRGGATWSRDVVLMRNASVFHHTL